MDMYAQYHAPDFHYGHDRLHLVVGEVSSLNRTVQGLSARATGRQSYDEWIGSLTEPQRKLIGSIRPLLTSTSVADETLLALFRHIEVKVWDQDYIEDSVLQWMPPSNREPGTVFRLLRDRAGGESRYKCAFDALTLRQNLYIKDGVQFKDPLSQSQGVDNRRGDATATTGEDELYLPAPPTPGHTIFGRSNEFGIILDALRERQTVLLHGLGGIGKSALATLVAQHLYQERLFRGGIVWISQLGTDSLADLCDAVARQLHNDEISLLPAARKPDVLRTLLAFQDIVLVVDDVTRVEIVHGLLHLCRPSGLAVLVTSRTQHTDFDVVIDLQEPALDAAMALFVDRTAQPCDSTVVRRICAVLENHPLALVIAAARVRAERMPLEKLHSRLEEEKTRLLTLVVDNSTSKDLNVRVSIEVSYDSLSRNARMVLLALSACFSRTTSVEFVTPMLTERYSMTTVRCEDGIGQLVARSLIDRIDAKLHLHQLVQDYGRNILVGEYQRNVIGVDLPTLQYDIADEAAMYVSQRQAHIVANYDALAGEIDNLMGSARYLFDKNEWQLAATVSLGMQESLDRRGLWARGLQIAKLGLEAARQWGNEEAIADGTWIVGEALMRQGHPVHARVLFEESLAISMRTDRQDTSVRAVRSLGVLAKVQGEEVRATQAINEILEAYRALQDTGGQADALHQLGDLALRRDNRDEARRLYHESKVLCSKNNDQRGVAHNLLSLGGVDWSEGHLDNAQTQIEEGLRIAEVVDDKNLMSGGLNTLAVIVYNRAQKEPNDAKRKAFLLEMEELLKRSLSLKEELNDVIGIATTCINFGQLAKDRGDYRQARQWYVRSLALYKQIGSPRVDEVQGALDALPSNI